jgi:hypothetical protein
MKYLFKYILLVLPNLITLLSFSQTVTGTIYDEAGSTMPFATIMIKGGRVGVTSNQEGHYQLKLAPGKYTLVCQYVGYESQEWKIKIDDEDVKHDWNMKPHLLMLSEIVVSNNDENPAYGVIRKTIQKRSFYNRQLNGFTCDVYTKDLIKIRQLPDRIFGQKIEKDDQKSMGLDTAGKGVIYLSENFARVHQQQPDKSKLEVISSRVSGSKGFGFAFPTFINFYQNNLDLFAGARGFVSPIADGALLYYKYKMLGTFEEDGKLVYSIRVTPRRNYEPCFSGIINIVDEDWNIHGLDLMLTKSAQLQLLDTLKIKQVHVDVTDSVRRVKDQILFYNIRFLGVDAIGTNLSVYNDYKINPDFPKGFFDRVVIKYDTAVNKKPKSFWDETRPIPLEVEEQNDYRKKDSLLQVAIDSEAVRNHPDTLRKKQGRIKWEDLLTTGINRTHYGDKHRFNWGIASLFTNTNFNTAEGVNVELNGYVNRVYRNKIRVDFRPSFRYGFSNTHFNAWGQLRVRSIAHPDDPDQFKSTWILSGGKQPVQYNPYMPISPLINTFSSLFDGKNEMKIYEKTYVQTVYERKYLNGITWKLETGYENRNAILNTNLYTVSSIDKVNYRENLPEGKNIVSPGQSNSAWISSAEISIQPGQKYIQYPKRLVSMGSDYPVFTARYRKAIPAFGKTDADFDRWEFDVAGQRNFKLGGLFKYDFSVGGFLNTRKVYVQDMRHFNSRAIRATLSYVNGFQMMGSYLNSNQAPWVLEGHVEHHFNGMFTNKIPMFKKWNWFLVAGANAYWINPKDQYQEWFVGLENIFKIFRVDWVNAYQEGKYQGSSFVVGAGGLLGGAFTANEGERSVSISF